jgi:hypothetical protein
MTEPRENDGSGEPKAPQLSAWPSSLAADLAALPVPPIDARISKRTLTRAHGELRMRGEGTISLAGLLATWDASLVPAIVLLTGVAYGAMAFVRILEIYVGT